jgi:hypothetical protein
MSCKPLLVKIVIQIADQWSPVIRPFLSGMQIPIVYLVQLNNLASLQLSKKIVKIRYFNKWKLAHLLLCNKGTIKTVGRDNFQNVNWIKTIVSKNYRKHFTPKHTLDMF